MSNEVTVAPSPPPPQAPKSRKTMLVALLLIAVIIVAVVGVFLWQSSQTGEDMLAPTPTASPTSSPVSNTYSKYGITFQYPEGMELTEKGMLESTATDSSGMVLGEINKGNLDKYELLGVAWLTSVTPLDLKISLNGGLDGMKTDEITAVNKGEIVSSQKDGDEMLYAPYSLEASGQTMYGICGVWYNDSTDRLLQLNLMSGHQNMLPEFQQYLDSISG